MHKNFPNPDEYQLFYEKYINDYSKISLKKTLKLKLNFSKRILRSIPKNKWNFTYAEGKWTVKELIQHILDAERVFVFRALHIVRKDPNPIFPFDENQYVLNSKANNRDSKSLIKEFLALSESSSIFFESLNEEQLNEKVDYNGAQISVRALGYILCGHCIHHFKVLKEKYLKY